MNVTTSVHACSIIASARGDATKPFSAPSGASDHSASSSAVDAGALGGGGAVDDDESFLHPDNANTDATTLATRALIQRL
jgi:hypothetical protein